MITQSTEAYQKQVETLTKELTELALSHSISEDTFDELVHNSRGEERSASYNSDEDDEEMNLVTKADEDDLDSWDDAFTTKGSNINNEGFESQIRYLVEGYNDLTLAESEIKTIIESQSTPT
jgi:hypothetical protein